MGSSLAQLVNGVQEPETELLVDVHFEFLLKERMRTMRAHSACRSELERGVERGRLWGGTAHAAAAEGQHHVGAPAWPVKLACSHV